MLAGNAVLTAVQPCLVSVSTYFSLMYYFECSYPVVFYCLYNYKIPVKTQHVISIMLYSDMFRLICVCLWYAYVCVNVCLCVCVCLCVFVMRGCFGSMYTVL